jgi:hypothetical protein
LLVGFGDVALGRGDYPSARTYYSQALDLSRQTKEQLRIIEILEGLAHLFAELNEPEKAAVLYGASNSGREALNSPRPRQEQKQIEEWLLNSRLSTGESSWQTKEAIGQAMSLDEAITQAMGFVLRG